jgi:hypothetical protein
MTHRGRLGALILVPIASAVFALAGGGAAYADHCPPIDNPDPLPGQNTEYCHTPTPTEKPKSTATPKPTTKPTSAPVATRPPVVSRPTATQPATAAEPTDTPFEIEVPDGDDPIEVTIDDGVPQGLPLEAEQAGGVSNWIFGFIVGFIVGGLAGRASWGLRRRRRQQIFG